MIATPKTSIAIQIVSLVPYQKLIDQGISNEEKIFQNYTFNLISFISILVKTCIYFF